MISGDSEILFQVSLTELSCVRSVSGEVDIRQIGRNSEYRREKRYVKEHTVYIDLIQ